MSRHETFLKEKKGRSARLSPATKFGRAVWVVEGAGGAYQPKIWPYSHPALRRRAVSFSDGRNDLPTAIRAPPPPRVAHSTPLGLLYLGTHAFFCRAAGSVVAPGFAVSPRPSGASPKGVCTRLGGFPVPRRKMHGRGASARQPEKSPASWLAAFASCGWQRRLSSAAEAAPALLSLLLGRFSL